MSCRNRAAQATAMAAFVLAAADASAQLTTGADLAFGPVPQGATLEVGPLDGRAARVDAGLAGPPPCEDRPAEFELVELPSVLIGPDAGTVELSFRSTSGRVWESADPGRFVEFDPSGEIAEFPIDGFPASVGIGGIVTVPDGAAVGEYSGEAVLEMTRYGPRRGCRPQTRSTEIPITVDVQGELTVEAAMERIDLGTLVHGIVVDAPADGSGEAVPAPFLVTGPSSLDYRLTVTTRNLEHEQAADELPLSFTDGLFGTDDPPDTAFGSGDVIPASDHGGGPLHIHCGFRVEVPEGVAEGRYQGDVTLTVEVLLH